MQAMPAAQAGALSNRYPALPRLAKSYIVCLVLTSGRGRCGGDGGAGWHDQRPAPDRCRRRSGRAPGLGRRQDEPAWAASLAGPGSRPAPRKRR